MRQKVSLFWRGCHLRDGKDADVFSSRVSLSLVEAAAGAVLELQQESRGSLDICG